LENTPTFSNYRVKKIIKSYENVLHDKKSEICRLREKVETLTYKLGVQKIIMEHLEEEGRNSRAYAAEKQKEAIEFIGPLNQCLGIARYKGQTWF